MKIYIEYLGHMRIDSQDVCTVSSKSLERNICGVESRQIIKKWGKMLTIGEASGQRLDGYRLYHSYSRNFPLSLKLLKNLDVQILSPSNFSQIYFTEISIQACTEALI